jgi:hypothetical protein
MTSITSPVNGVGGQTATPSAARPTSPMTASFAAGAPAGGDAVAAIQVGIATQYWDECVALPAGSTASLWLFVDNAWRAHDNPTASTKDMVQRAFLGAGSVVRVWYDNAAVVGLVVSG